MVTKFGVIYGDSNVEAHCLNLTCVWPANDLLCRTNQSIRMLYFEGTGRYHSQEMQIYSMTELLSHEYGFRRYSCNVSIYRGPNRFTDHSKAEYIVADQCTGFNGTARSSLKSIWESISSSSSPTTALQADRHI